MEFYVFNEFLMFKPIKPVNLVPKEILPDLHGEGRIIYYYALQQSRLIKNQNIEAGSNSHSMSMRESSQYPSL
jgi:hypothetical protein